jgi:hypothetical protein
LIRRTSGSGPAGRLRTNLKGGAGRKDLARQYLAQNRPKCLVDEADLRNFYKNHERNSSSRPAFKSENCFCTAKVRVTEDKTKDKAYVLGQELAERIRKESLGPSGYAHVPEEQRDRAQVHEFEALRWS